MPARRPASAPTLALLCALLALALAACRRVDRSIHIAQLSPIAGTLATRAVRIDGTTITLSAPAPLRERVAEAVLTLEKRGAVGLRLQPEGVRSSVRVVAVGPDGTEPVMRWWSPLVAATRFELLGTTRAAVFEA